MELADDIYSLTRNFPGNEDCILTSQIRRVSDPIALNISEGAILHSNPGFRKFVGYSIRSLAEVVTCFHGVKRREYISPWNFDSFYIKVF